MSDHPQLNPHARSDDLVVEAVDEGLVVFDRLADTAHWLDPAAASVWRLADGRHDVAGIAAACRRSEAEVADLLLRLDGLNLIVEQDGGGLSRRAALKRIAKAGAAGAAGAAVISSVVVPNALAAASVCDTVLCSYTGDEAFSCTEAQSNASLDCTTNSNCRSSSTCVGTCTSAAGRYSYTGTCSY